jgi:Ca2+-binding EF-hand superfamily protein
MDTLEEPIQRSRQSSLFSKAASFNFDEFIAHLQESRDKKIGRQNQNEFKEMLKKVKFPGITREEALYYIEAFTIFDLDGNGSINEEELWNAMETLEMNMSPDQVKKMIQTVDVDGNGDVSLEEFVRLMVSIRSKNKFIKTDHQIKDAFALVDVDRDGKLGPDDLVALFLDVGEVITLENAQEMVIAVSKKEDGFVTMSDFHALIREADF